MPRRERLPVLRGVLLTAALALLGSGCTALDNTLAAVPVFAFMREAPFFDPYEAPRPAPEFSVPYDSPVGVDVPPIEASENGLNAFAATPWGVNPLDPADTAVQALGQKMFDRFCLVCHGADGKGNGPITGENKYPPIAPNLTLPITVNRPDGYIYGMIRVARSGLMPAYGQRTNHRERWAIVSYVRTLQAAAASADSSSAAAPAARN